jgi:hypothetical protein
MDWEMAADMTPLTCTPPPPTPTPPKNNNKQTNLRWEDKVMALRAFKGTRGASSISIGILLLGGMSATPCLRAEKWLPVSNGVTVGGESRRECFEHSFIRSLCVAALSIRARDALSHTLYLFSKKEIRISFFSSYSYIDFCGLRMLSLSLFLLFLF